MSREVVLVDSEGRPLSLLADVVQSPGAPQQNRLRMGFKPGAGETVVFAGRTYEYRAVTPPVGGGAGRILLYNGADPAASLLALADAVNGVVDPARINYNGLAKPLWTADLSAPDCWVRTTTAAGSNVTRADGTPVACTHTLLGVGDGWDDTQSFGGLEAGPQHFVALTVEPTADMGSRGYRIRVPFVVDSAVLTLNAGAAGSETPAIVWLGDTIDVDAIVAVLGDRYTLQVWGH